MVEDIEDHNYCGGGSLLIRPSKILNIGRETRRTGLALESMDRPILSSPFNDVN